MVAGTCHCGAVRIELDVAPDKINDCQCSHCRKRGALWAYASPRQVRVVAAEGATLVCLCNGRVLETHICRTCGCTTHWSPVDKTYDRMGVNARLLDPEVLAQATIRVSPGPA